MPKVSVIMNCFNCSEYLREAIDSVYAQTFEDWEIIFWDNASMDNSAEIAKSYDERLRYFRGEETVPLGKARNLAIEKARGEYIAFLDCDDIWLPEKIEKQIPLFEQNSKVGLVFCDTFLFNNKGKSRQIYKNNKPPKGRIFRELLLNYFLYMQTVVIRKDALNTLSEWFDERLTMNEEADLFIRLAYNWEADYVDEPLAKWRVHDKSLTWNKKELFPIEYEMMLHKYIMTIPNFDNDFPDEIKFLRLKVLKQHFLLECERGNSKTARNLLRPHSLKDCKSFSLYMLSYLPYSIFIFLINHYKNLKLRVTP